MRELALATFITFVIVAGLSVFVRAAAQTKAQESNSVSLRSLRSLAFVALSVDGGDISRAPKHAAAFYYTHSDSVAKQANSLGWTSVLLPSDSVDKSYFELMPFALFEIGLKFNAVVYVGDGAKPVNLDVITKQQQQATNEVVQFADGVWFIPIQSSKARRVMFDIWKGGDLKQVKRSARKGLA